MQTTQIVLQTTIQYDVEGFHDTANRVIAEYLQVNYTCFHVNQPADIVHEVFEVAHRIVDNLKVMNLLCLRMGIMYQI